MSENRQPSRRAERLLEWALPADRRDDITGDLDEVFTRLERTRGLSEARLWYWREALMLAVRFSIERLRERGARRRTGSRTNAATRASGGLRRLISVSPLDIKLGVRMLFKNPSLTLVSTVALAIAIAIVAGFHTATQFMVSPKLPLPEGDRVVAIWQHDIRAGELGTQTLGDMLTWDRELATLEDVGGFRLQERAVSLDGATRVARAAEITSSVFDRVRIPPELGRPLLEADAQPGGAAVVVIGYDFWQTALDADPMVLGRSLRIGGVVHTIVGVMPDGFGFPRREELWMPLPLSAGMRPDEGPAIDFAVARLAPHVTIEDVEAELQVVAARLAAAYPQSHERLRPRVARYALSFIESGEPGLATLMHAARLAIGILLLVVAVNVGTLIYARNAVRLEEIAVRMALGASRRRVVVQMFIEALMLSALAAVVGVGILLWPMSRFREIFDTAIAQDDGIPYWFEVGFGAHTILLVVGLTLLSAVLTGVLPALKLTGSRVQTQLQRVQQGGATLRFGRTTTLVVVAQVALSVALLTVGGAQLRGFVEDWWSFDDRAMGREQLLTAQLRWDLGTDSAAAGDARDALARAEARRELGRRAVSELGVEGASFDSYQGVRFFAPDTPGPDSETQLRWSYAIAIAPNYFDVQAAPVLAGRAFGAADVVDSAAAVAVVNEAFVQAMLPVGDPIGQHVRQLDPRTRQVSGEPLRIVGVIGDTPSLEISQRGPAWVARPTLFLPLRDTAAAGRMLVRSRGEPGRLIGPLQALAADVDPSLFLRRVRTLDEDDRVAFTFAGLYGLAVGFFVFAALLLSTTGVYAMMSFTATQRTREIGIRTALGAPARHVVGAVFSRAMKQLGAGTAIGLGIGYLAADGPMALSGGLFAEGPGVVFGVAVLILAMGLIGCAKPMRRALSIEPTQALRTDG